MANITHPNAGQDVVSYMTYLRRHTYGDAAHQSAKVIPVQYRIIVTSPLGYCHLSFGSCLISACIRFEWSSDPFNLFQS